MCNLQDSHKVYLNRLLTIKEMMKKKILHIGAGLIFVIALIFPSCELLEECGDCYLVKEDNEGNITYGDPIFVCGETYRSYNESEIITTIDGQEYWVCE